MSARPRPPSLHEVQASMAQAADGQLARIVAMVDSLPNRGQADALIAPLRQRLAQLRPARPFGLTRLLFTPIDPVIVAPTKWRRGEVGVPRPALAPTGEAVRAALPELAASLDAGATAVRPDDRGTIAALGAQFWPAAAIALEQMVPPPDWSQAAGLSPTDWNDLARTMSCVLGEAVAIERLAIERQPPADSAIRAVLSRAERRGGLALATVTAVLLARLPMPEQVLSIVADGGTSSRRSGDEAMEHTLARLQAFSTAAAEDFEPTEAAVDTARVAAMLAGLEVNAPPERRRRLEAIRRDADALCLARCNRVAAAATYHLHELGSDRAAVPALEAMMRDLRRLETAGRRLGSGDQYDVLLRTVASGVRGEDCGLELSDQVRLVEILCGPDEALAMLVPAS